jgi:hypothetical protein
MIAKNISTSRKVNRLPDRAALLYTWMIPHTDDYGHLEGDPLSIRAKVAPMRTLNEQEVQQDLELMVQNDLIRFYSVEGETYIEIINFDTFQTFKSDRPRSQEYPLPIDWKPSNSARKPVDSFAPDKRREENIREVKLREEKGPHGSIKYLSNIPEADMKEFLTRFVASKKEIEGKAEDLKLYCERNGRTYKNYRSFLLGALRRDFKEKAEKEGKYAKLS